MRPLCQRGATVSHCVYDARANHNAARERPIEIRKRMGFMAPWGIEGNSMFGSSNAEPNALASGPWSAFIQGSEASACGSDHIRSLERLIISIQL